MALCKGQMIEEHGEIHAARYNKLRGLAGFVVA
jgi:hypothetical protein